MSKKPKRIAAVALIALASPSVTLAQQSIFTPSQRAEGEADIQKAAILLANSMRDPASATFRSVFIQKRINPKTGEHVALCGEVNARNAYGGLTGFQKFMLVGDQVYTGAGRGLFDANFLCGNNNPIIDSRDYAVEMRRAYAAATKQ